MAKKKKRKIVTPEATTHSQQQQQVSTTARDYFSVILLTAIAFLSGLLVMVIELTSSRLLAPYFGNTIYCWTGVIGTILFALSLGYFVGGILADRYPKENLLIVLLAISSITVASVPFVARFFSNSFAAYDSMIWGPIIGTILVFALPAFALSLLPPLCVKTIFQNFKLVGLASGLISSISTTGSIVGTFLTGFYLIPSFNLSTIYYIAAGILFALLALVVTMYKKLSKLEISMVAIVVPFVLFLLWQGFANVRMFPDDGNIYEKLTSYHLIRVYDEVHHHKLTLDSTPEGAISKSGNELVFEYTKYWELIKCFLKDTEQTKACFVGGGAFAMPIMLHRDMPKTAIDVIEIDPALIPVGKDFFHLQESSNFQVHALDGRRWFRGKQKFYDFVFLDAFHGVRSIPAHLVTSEYFGELNTSLKEHGVLAINLISTKRKGSFYQSLVKSLLQNFEKVFVFSVYNVPDDVDSNIILYCTKDAQLYTQESLEKAAKRHQILPLQKKLREVLTKDNLKDYQNVPALTDEYAPVEYMVAKDN